MITAQANGNYLKKGRFITGAALKSDNHIAPHGKSFSTANSNALFAEAKRKQGIK